MLIKKTKYMRKQFLVFVFHMQDSSLHKNKEEKDET